MNMECISSTNHTNVAIAVDCQALIREAERELGAFLSAVAIMFGSQAARHAAEQWLEVLDSDTVFIHNPTPSFRNITIRAASCLASSWIKLSYCPLALPDEASATGDREFPTLTR